MHNASDRIGHSSTGRSFLAWLNRRPLWSRLAGVRFGADVLRGHRWDRVLALWFWKWGWREQTERRSVEVWLDPGMRAVDAGANVGLFSLLMARRVGPSGRVWAFEPEPGNFACLERNLARADLPQVTCLPRALGRESKAGALYLSASNAGDHQLRASPGELRPSIPVDVVALDSVWPRHEPLHFIKMDIQGSEAEAFEGMRQTWRVNPDLVMLFEFWPAGLRDSGSDPARFLDALRGEAGRVRAVLPDGRGGPEVESAGELVRSLGRDGAKALLAGPRREPSAASRRGGGRYNPAPPAQETR